MAQAITGYQHTLYGLIQEIIEKETKYLRHYYGQVINNIHLSRQGFVQVRVPTLGWERIDQTPFCRPRDKHSMDVPGLGEWVEVYFMEGNRDTPAYLGNCPELYPIPPATAVPRAYDGNPTTHVLYESPIRKDSIAHDDLLSWLTTKLGIGGSYTVKVGIGGNIDLVVGAGGTININAGTGSLNLDGTMIRLGLPSAEPALKGLTTQTQLLIHQNAITLLQAALQLWIPVPLDGGLALKTALTTFLAAILPNYSTTLSAKFFHE